MTDSIVGARAVVLQNGNAIAFTNSLSYNIDQALTPIEVLDQLEPAELAETGYHVTLTTTTFRRYGFDAITQGIQQNLQNLLTQPELTFEVQDRLNPTAPPLVITRVKMNNNSGNVTARGVWEETWNFMGITAYFEGGAG